MRRGKGTRGKKRQNSKEVGHATQHHAGFISLLLIILQYTLSIISCYWENWCSG